MVAAKKKKTVRRKPTDEELAKANHRKQIRSIFRNAGFVKVNSVSDVEFTFKGRAGDFDDVFIYENIIVFAEYTVSQSSGISTHLLKKKILFDHVKDNPEEFINYFETTFPTFKEVRDDYFSPDECKIVVVYCSKNSISVGHKDQVANAVFFDYAIVQYFLKLSSVLKHSSRFELFDFFSLKREDIGHGSVTSTSTSSTVHGMVLPEKNSNFDSGFKVVSFYIDPARLLSRAYVMRKDGWREETGLYQRMIRSPKIRAIRRYLNTKRRVFVNNIIITLPDDTKLLDDDGNTVEPSKLKDTLPVSIQIPEGFNTIGLVDGQHRVFAYHEGGEFEEKISQLREKQNLLATGIIYPKGLSAFEKIKFESELFLEINSNQTNADSELKQAIVLILKPFSPESIAKAVLNRLNSRSPLENEFERHFYEKGKIKTTSIVSYAMRPLVKLSGDDSLFKLWKHPDKSQLEQGDNTDLLELYLQFSTTEISTFFSAVKANATKSQWTTDRNIRNKILSTTAINGLLICLRLLIESNLTGDFDHYRDKFSGLDRFDFGKYKSSQYAAMSKALFKKFFS